MTGVANLQDVEAIETRGMASDHPATTYELLRRTRHALARAPALSYFSSAREHRQPRTWNYGELFSHVTRAANAFHHLGADRDSVIAVVLPNFPETHFAVWGAQAAGICMPVNYLLQPEAIAALLDVAGATLLVTAPEIVGHAFWERLSPHLTGHAKLRHVLLVGGGDSVQPLPRGGGPWELHDFAACLRTQPDDALVSARVIEPDDYSSFLCTGGTTGAPKVAMRRHRNEVTNAWSTAQCLGDAIGPGRNVFCGLPLFHANGLLVTGLLPFSRGAHVVLGTPLGYRDPNVLEQFWSIVDHHQIHLFSAVPTVYSALLQVPRGTHQVASLDYGLCGAAPMPREVIHRFEAATGVRILEGYGLTEGTCVSSLNPPEGERRAGSIGLRLPNQAMKAVICDPDGGYVRDAADGENGLLVISGPNVFAGYLRAPDDSNAWLDLGDGHRWLVTGDLGHCDAQGYFWLAGRARDLIIRGGHNIDPAAIEQPLHAHPAVELAAAVGRPDVHSGELPVAYVQTKPGHAVSANELLTYLEPRIRERAAMPKALVLLEDMPLTAVGKINKPELRRRETELSLRNLLADSGIRVAELGVGPDGVAAITLEDARDKASAEAVVSALALRFLVH